MPHFIVDIMGNLNTLWLVMQQKCVQYSIIALNIEAALADINEQPLEPGQYSSSSGTWGNS